MITFYVINATRGEVIEVLATDSDAARRESYNIQPEWWGNWIVVTRISPTQEEIDSLVAGLPEDE